MQEWEDADLTDTARHRVIRRVELQTAYAPFAEPVNALLARLHGLDDPTTERTFKAHGTASDVFVLELDGGHYAVRMQREHPQKSFAGTAQYVDCYVTGALRVLGVADTEQIVAASYEHGVVISELLPGDRPYGLPAAIIDQISVSQLTGLIHLVHAQFKAGQGKSVHIDNFLYDLVAGFSKTDFEDTGEHLPASMLNVILSTWNVVRDVGLAGTDPLTASGSFDFSRAHDQHMANMRLADRFLMAIQNSFPEALTDTSSRPVSERIQRHQQSQQDQAENCLAYLRSAAIARTNTADGF